MPIAVFWLALAAVTNVFVPQLENVAKQHNVSLSPQDAPSLQASKRIGKVFQEFDSDSSAMIVLEGDQPLGADAHHYYDGLIKKLSQDTKHVEHIQDFWGDPLTAAGSQSTDGKAALVQVYLAGNQGESLSNQSVDSVRDIVDRTPPPPGVKAYVTGPAPLVTDQFEVGSKGTLKVTLITIAVIVIMLFFNLPLRHSDSRPFHGDDRIDRDTRSRRRSGELRDHRAVDVFDQSADATGHRRGHGLCDLHPRPLSRSAPCRGGSGSRLLHDVPGDRAHHLGFGPDNRRRGILSELHPASVFSEPGHSRRNWRPRRVGGRADPGAGDVDHRPTFRSVRPQAARCAPGAGGVSARPSSAGPAPSWW